MAIAKEYSFSILLSVFMSAFGGPLRGQGGYRLDR